MCRTSILPKVGIQRHLQMQNKFHTCALSWNRCHSLFLGICSNGLRHSQANGRLEATAHDVESVLNAYLAG